MCEGIVLEDERLIETAAEAQAALGDAVVMWPDDDDDLRAGGVGDRVDRFGAGLFPRQWQHRLHGCYGRLVCFLIAGTFAAPRAIGQTRQTPGRLALLGGYGRAFDGHGAALFALLLFELL
jgi:hypothetical protein